MRGAARGPPGAAGFPYCPRGGPRSSASSCYAGGSSERCVSRARPATAATAAAALTCRKARGPTVERSLKGACGGGGRRRGGVEAGGSDGAESGEGTVRMAAQRAPQRPCGSLAEALRRRAGAGLHRAIRRAGRGIQRGRQPHHIPKGCARARACARTHSNTHTHTHTHTHSLSHTHTLLSLSHTHTLYSHTHTHTHTLLSHTNKQTK